MKNTAFAAILFTLLCSLSAGAEVRTWTSGKHTVEAELIDVSKDGKSITLRRSDNGKEVTLTLDKVSDKDRRYVEEQKKQPSATRSGSKSDSKGISVAPAAGKCQRRALLIGVNDYETLKPLKFCEADATALRDALVKLGFDPGDITLLISGGEKRPTRLNIEEQLESLFDGLTADDMVLISLSGHGGQFEFRSGASAKRESFFCPEDARTNRPDRTMISTREIYGMLDRCPARFKMLLIDACRDEHFMLDGAKMAIDESRSMSDFTKSITDGKLPKSTVAMISCVGGQQSYESPKLQQGIFMYHIVQGSLGKADSNGDGIVSLFELRDYVTQQTKDFAYRELKKSQTPRFHAEWETSDFGLFDLNKLGTTPEIGRPLGPVVQYPGLDGTPGKLLRAFGETNPLNARDNYGVTCVAYSPDGSMIASGGMDKNVKIWDVLTGEQISAVGHTGDITSICFSPSSNLILSTSRDGLIKISKAENGETVCRSTWDQKFGRADTWHGAFSPDERHVAIATGGQGQGVTNAAHLLYVKGTNAKLIRSFTGHRESVKSVAFSPDGKWLLTGSDDKMLSVWDVQTGKSLKTLSGHANVIKQVAFSPDGKFAMSLSRVENTLRIWDLETDTEIRSFTNAERSTFDSQKYFLATFSPSGKTIIACITNEIFFTYSSPMKGDWNTIKLWDASTGKERGSFDCTLKQIRGIAVSPDGQTIVIGALGDGDPTSSPKLQLLSTGLKE